MGLFQKSVIAKYLKFQSNDVVSAKWKQYTSHFLNPKVQDEIRELKEEQYQGEFLEDLFVKILGYTKPASSSETKFNLTTEYKNVKDAKKADGAIIIENKVVAVIELKGCDTIDLGKVEAQAFNYKNNQPECIYVITSNFEKLRLYIDNAIEHIEFNLFSLTEEDFKLLYLCLSFDNISQNIAKKIKDESLSEEDVITKKLYKDYSVFKRVLHQNLVTLNPNFDPLLLFKKSQKLLDRFLFLFFGEDRNLLPPNSVRLILSDWKDLQERDVVIPLYDRFKKYFEYLNTGFKGKRYDVFAYNGGLFKSDEVLDTIKIDDEILFKHTTKLSEYDFASEVDVNILGHIFENSLNELDEIKAELEGTVIDKSKTKRKKDGVFYTPKYITKYIVENTVGKLCNEKKAELQIIEEDYSSDKKRTKATKQPLLEKLETYRKWLLQLTICDPACGSGAFLNQALDFLINEHKYIDELQAKLFGDALILSDIENSILENNLYGVDLNEESVEIAKLSLWLRTAQPNRKLNDLNNNIKCGNSLIDDPQIAGDKAFNWFLEFPKVFPHYRKPKENIPFEPEPGDRDYLDELQEPLYSYKTGSKGFGKYGFDVIIGNPPYVFSRDNFKQEEKDFYVSNYFAAKYQINTYLLFIEKSVNILKWNGVYGLIIPNAWLMVYSGEGLRKFLLESNKINQIINLKGYSFESANVETVILIAEKEKCNIDNSLDIYLNNGTEFYFSHKKNQSDFLKNKGFEFKVFLDDESDMLNTKLTHDSKTLDDLVDIKAGLQAYEKDKGDPKQTEDDVKSRPYDYNFKFDKNTHKYLDGKDVGRYYLSWSGLYLRYGKHLAAPRTFNLFDGRKIIVREITGNFPKCLVSTYTEELFLYNRSNIAIVEKPDSKVSLKYILALLNSTLMSYYFMKNTAKSVRKLFPKIILNDLRKFPIKIISSTFQVPIITQVDIMLSTNMNLQELSQKFQRTIKRKFELEDLSIKLQDWYKLSYPEFIKELAKKKVKLSLSQEAEWEDYFNQESKKALELKATIDATDKEIDRMVYELYDLTDEEIAIVEQS